MTPSERNIVKSLIAVAWADGKLEAPESGVIEGMLSGFDASAEEEQELLEYGRTRRGLDDIPLSELGKDDRELLLANAALLTHADGEQSESERATLDALVKVLGFGAEDAQRIIDSADDGALVLSSKVLENL
jgi:tellurite resistance protein